MKLGLKAQSSASEGLKFGKSEQYPDQTLNKSIIFQKPLLIKNT